MIEKSDEQIKLTFFYLNMFFFQEITSFDLLFCEEKSTRSKKSLLIQRSLFEI